MGTKHSEKKARRRIGQRELVRFFGVLWLIGLPFVMFYRYRLRQRTISIAGIKHLVPETSQTSEYTGAPLRFFINGETWFLGNAEDEGAQNAQNVILLSQRSQGRIRPVLTVPLNGKLLEQAVYSEEEGKFYCRVRRLGGAGAAGSEDVCDILSVDLDPGFGVRTWVYTGQFQTVWRRRNNPRLMAYGPEGVMISWSAEGRHYISCFSGERLAETIETAGAFAHPACRAGRDSFVAWCGGFPDAPNGIAMIDSAGNFLSEIFDCGECDEVLDMLTQNGAAYILLRSEGADYMLAVLDYSDKQRLSFRLRELPDVSGGSHTDYNVLFWDEEKERLEIGLFARTNLGSGGYAGVLCLEAPACKNAEVYFVPESTTGFQTLIEAYFAHDGWRHYFFMAPDGSCNRFAAKN